MAITCRPPKDNSPFQNTMENQQQNNKQHKLIYARSLNISINHSFVKLAVSS